MGSAGWVTAATALPVGRFGQSLLVCASGEEREKFHPDVEMLGNFLHVLSPTKAELSQAGLEEEPSARDVTCANKVIFVGWELFIPQTTGLASPVSLCPPLAAPGTAWAPAGNLCSCRGRSSGLGLTFMSPSFLLVFPPENLLKAAVVSVADPKGWTVQLCPHVLLPGSPGFLPCLGILLHLHGRFTPGLT